MQRQARLSALTNDNSIQSDTRVGTINIHTQATNAQDIAANIEPHLQRGQAVARGNYGLA